MLSVNIQKDIGEYTEKVWFGLSARRLASLAVAAVLGIAIAFFGVTVLGVDVSVVSIPIMIEAVLCFAVGYAQPLGMPLEKAAVLYGRHYLTDNGLVYKSSAALEEEARRAAEKNEKKNSKENTADVRKKKHKAKVYANDRSGRGAYCAETFVCRYYEEYAKAHPEAAEGGGEGAGEEAQGDPRRTEGGPQGGEELG